MSVKVSTTGITVDGNTVLQIKTGNEGFGKVLVSDSTGNVDWVSPRGFVSTERYIGEIYGGGIVVAIWDDGDDQKVMIATLQDATSTSEDFSGFTTTTLLNVWSAFGSNFAGATSMYDGAANYAAARSLYGITTGLFTRAAVDFDYGTNLSTGPYTDWYLPSIYEMKAMFANAHVINRVLGENNFKVGPRHDTPKYWTSTEIDANKAWVLDATMTGPIFSSESKGSVARIRPVRIENRSVGNGLATSLDVTNKTSYNDSTLPGRWSDLVNYGLTSSYSFTFASINSTGPTYSTLQGGYLYFNGNSYVDIYSPIGNTNVVTVEMWVRIKPQSANRMLFGWANYDIYWVDGVGLGFNTGNGDLYGISNATFTSLGIVDRWVHFVFEMRSGVAYSNNKIYIDGQLQTTLVQGAGTQNIPNTNFSSGNGRIGCWTAGLLTSGGTPYLGVFDLSVFKIYKRALTQTEINLGYNKYKRKYDIGITQTHTLDNGVGPGTFSVSQNLQLNLAGKKNLKVLKSTALGNASWVDKNYLFYRPDNEKFVGDLYGGGVIVSSFRYPANVFNYTIMSTVDISSAAAWSNITNSSIYTGEFAFLPGQPSWFQDFNGPTNSFYVTTQAFHSTSAAKLCNDYTGGFTGWYLPAVQELSDAFKNLAGVGYVSGTSSFRGRYWTSTEYNATNAYTFDTGSLTQSAYWFVSSKSSTQKVRAFRRARVLANYKVWNENAPEDEPTGDWYVNPWDEKNWKPYGDVRRTNLQFEFRTDNVDCYNGRFNGLNVSTGAAKSSVNGYTGTVLSQVAWSSEMNALQFNGAQSSFAPTDSFLDFGTALSTQSIPITLEAWIHPTYTTDNNMFKGIFSTCVPVSSSYYGFTLYVTRSVNGTYNPGIFWGDGLGSNQGTNIRRGYTSNDPIPPNEWCHVVGVMTGYSDIRIYVNGTYVNTLFSGSAGQIGLNASGKTMIGNFPGNVKFIFGGYIGTVRCYSVGLSAEEVKNNFERDRFRYDV